MRTLIQDSHGFTFIEVIICTAIAALICLGVSGVFNQFFATDSYVMGTLNNVRDGNSIMNQITEELKYAETVDPPSGGGSALTFNYFQDPIKRSFFINGSQLYFNNGSEDILIGQNVNSIQFSIVDNDKKIVGIDITVYDTEHKKDLQLYTTVKLLNARAGI